MAELGKAGAGKQEVADELARLEAESAVEERRVQVGRLSVVMDLNEASGAKHQRGPVCYALRGFEVV